MEKDCCGKTSKHKKIDPKAERIETFYPKPAVNVMLRSCEKEIDEPIEGKITGLIPEWLNGCLIRNGSGLLKVGDSEVKHLFDGFALLHRFSIKKGNVTYQCKFIKSDIFKKSMEAKRIVVTGFATASVPDPCQNIFQRFATIFERNEPSDNPNISIYPFGDKLYAFSESPVMFEINQNNINTENKVRIDNFVKIVHHTSHPHIVSDGTVYNMGTSVTLNGPQHNIICFPCNKHKASKNINFESTKIVAKIPSTWKLHPSYMHSFGITDNYFIIVEQPLNLSVPLVIKSKILNTPLASTLKWFHDNKTQINVIDRKTGKLAYKYLADAFFYLHIINQYEFENYIVIDICCYNDASVLDCMYIDSMRAINFLPNCADMFRSKPLRFVLPLTKNHSLKNNLIQMENSKATAYFRNKKIYVFPELLCDLGCEMPQINYNKCSGKYYRYFYAMSADVDSEYPGMLIKVDNLTNTSKIWHEKNCYASEPVFVEAPNAIDEDDGILLSALVWGFQDTNHITLLVLNAKTMKEIGRCDFNPPTPVPKCFHGWFISD